MHEPLKHREKREPQTEFRIFRFIGRLPDRFRLLFFLGLAVYALKYAVNFAIPLAQKGYIDQALKTGRLWGGDAAYLLSLMAASALLLLCEYAGFRKLRIRLREYLYRQTVNRVLELPKHVVQTHGSAYYTSVFTNLTQSLSTLISPSIFDFFFGFAQMVGVNFIIYAWCRPVFFLFLGAYALTALNTYVFHTLRKRHMDVISTSGAKLAADSNEIVSNNFVLKTSSGAAHFTGPLWDTLRENNSAQDSLYRALELNRFLFSAVKYAAFFLMLVIVLGKISASAMSYGQLLAIIAYFESLFAPFHSYVTFLGDLTNYGSWVRRYEEAFPDQAAQAALSAELPMKINSVELRDVKLPYGRRSKAVSFRIDGRIGITGISGEGKSSILKMLYREVLPDSGDVVINGGLSYRNVPAGYYYSAFNIVSQNTEIFNRTLQDNVLLGRTLLTDAEKERAMAGIISALKGLRPGLHSTLDLEPQLRPLACACGMNEEGTGDSRHFLAVAAAEGAPERAFNSNYVLKSEYESVTEALNLKKLAGRNLGAAGEHMSGGERQRIAFARFLLRKDYEFYVMDEPLVALDAVHEALLIKLLARCTAGKKGILISHNFSVLEKLSEKVMLITDGEASEEGTVAQLRALGGQYSALRAAYYANNADTATD